MRVLVAATSSAYERAAVAVPDSVCKKFSAVRSPVTMLRAGPSRVSPADAVGNFAEIAVVGVPSDRDSRIELPKRLVEPGTAA